MGKDLSAYPSLNDVLESEETELLRLRVHLAGRTGSGPRRELVITDRSWHQLYKNGVQCTTRWEEIHGLHWQRLWNRALLIVRFADPLPPFREVQNGWSHRYRLHWKELVKLENMLYLRLGNARGGGDWTHGLPDQVRFDDFNRSPVQGKITPALRVQVRSPNDD